MNLSPLALFLGLLGAAAAESDATATNTVMAASDELTCFFAQRSCSRLPSDTADLLRHSNASFRERSAQHRLAKDEIQIGLFFPYRTGVLAAAAVDDDVTWLFDAHDGSVELLEVGVVLIHLLFAAGLFVRAVPESPSRTGVVARHVATGARVEVGHGARRLELGLHEDPPKPQIRAELRRDQEIVPSDHPQAGQDRGILEKRAAVFDLVRQREGLDAELLAEPDPQTPRLLSQNPVSRREAGDLEAPPVEDRFGRWVGQGPYQDRSVFGLKSMPLYSG